MNLHECPLQELLGVGKGTREGLLFPPYWTIAFLSKSPGTLVPGQLQDSLYDEQLCS